MISELKIGKYSFNGLVNGSKENQILSQELDTGSFVIAHLDKIYDDIKLYDEVSFVDNFGNKKRYLLNSKDFQICRYGTQTMYNFVGTFVSYAYLLQRIPLPNISHTKSLSLKIFPCKVTKENGTWKLEMEGYQETTIYSGNYDSSLTDGDLYYLENPVSIKDLLGLFRSIGNEGNINHFRVVESISTNVNYILFNHTTGKFNLFNTFFWKKAKENISSSLYKTETVLDSGDEIIFDNNEYYLVNTSSNKKRQLISYSSLNGFLKGNPKTYFDKFFEIFLTYKVFEKGFKISKELKDLLASEICSEFELQENTFFEFANTLLSKFDSVITVRFSSLGTPYLTYKKLTQKGNPVNTEYLVNDQDRQSTVEFGNTLYTEVENASVDLFEKNKYIRNATLTKANDIPLRSDAEYLSDINGYFHLKNIYDIKKVYLNLNTPNHLVVKYFTNIRVNVYEIGNDIRTLIPVENKQNILLKSNNENTKMFVGIGNMNFINGDNPVSNDNAYIPFGALFLGKYPEDSSNSITSTTTFGYNAQRGGKIISNDDENFTISLGSPYMWLDYKFNDGYVISKAHNSMNDNGYTNTNYETMRSYAEGILATDDQFDYYFNTKIDITNWVIEKKLYDLKYSTRYNYPDEDIKKYKENFIYYDSDGIKGMYYYDKGMLDLSRNYAIVNVIKNATDEGNTPIFENGYRGNFSLLNKWISICAGPDNKMMLAQVISCDYYGGNNFSTPKGNYYYSLSNKLYQWDVNFFLQNLNLRKMFLRKMTLDIVYYSTSSNKLLFSKNNIKEENILIDHQDNSFVNANLYGKQENLKASRIGNNEKVLTYRYPKNIDYNKIPKLGDYYLKDYIVYNTTLTDYKNYLIFQALCSKYYVNNVLFTSLASKKRVYQLAGDYNSHVRKDIKKYYIQISTDKTKGLRYSFLDSLKNLVSSEERTSNLVNTAKITFYDKENNKISEIYEPIDKKIYYNSIGMAIGETNNSYVNMPTISKPSDSSFFDIVFDGDHTKTTIGGYEQKRIFYVDENGEFEYATFDLFSRILALSNMNYPKALESDYLTNTILSFNKTFYKDNRDVFNLTFQFEFGSDSDNIVIGSSLVSTFSLISSINIYPGYITFNTGKFNPNQIYEQNLQEEQTKYYLYDFYEWDNEQNCLKLKSNIPTVDMNNINSISVCDGDGNLFFGINTTILPNMIRLNCVDSVYDNTEINYSFVRFNSINETKESGIYYYKLNGNDNYIDISNSNETVFVNGEIDKIYLKLVYNSEFFSTIRVKEASTGNIIDEITNVYNGDDVGELEENLEKEVIINNVNDILLEVEYVRKRFRMRVSGYTQRQNVYLQYRTDINSDNWVDYNPGILIHSSTNTFQFRMKTDFGGYKLKLSQFSNFPRRRFTEAYKEDGWVLDNVYHLNAGNKIIYFDLENYVGGITPEQNEIDILDNNLSVASIEMNNETLPLKANTSFETLYWFGTSNRTIPLTLNTTFNEGSDSYKYYGKIEIYDTSFYYLNGSYHSYTSFKVAELSSEDMQAHSTTINLESPWHFYTVKYSLKKHLPTLTLENTETNPNIQIQWGNRKDSNDNVIWNDYNGENVLSVYENNASIYENDFYFRMKSNDSNYIGTLSWTYDLPRGIEDHAVIVTRVPNKWYEATLFVGENDLTHSGFKIYRNGDYIPEEEKRIVVEIDPNDDASNHVHGVASGQEVSINVAGGNTYNPTSYTQITGYNYREVNITAKGGNYYGKVKVYDTITNEILAEFRATSSQTTVLRTISLVYHPNIKIVISRLAY